MSGSYCAYNSHGWILAAPTWSFIISAVLLQLAVALQLLPHFTFDLHTCFPKVMARCILFSEAAANMTEAEDVDKVASTAEVTQTASENPIASDAEGRLSSPDAAEGSQGKGSSDDEKSWTYYFGSSIVTANKIKEMMEKGYFVEGEAWAPGAETVWESNNDEVVVYEEFFVAGLRMPPHPTLADILIKFQVQLHQLMPNTIAQLSKYFWAVGSFGGIPEGNAFVKWYKLH
jgi:PKD repeat protein